MQDRQAISNSLLTILFVLKIACIWYLKTTTPRQYIRINFCATKKVNIAREKFCHDKTSV